MMDLVISLLFSLLDFLKGAFIFSIPVFFVTFFGVFLFRFFSKKYSLSWIKASFLSTYITVLLLVFFLYLFPFISALLEINYGVVPEQYGTSAAEWIFLGAYTLLRLVLVAIVLALFVLLLEFAGLFVFEALRKRFPTFSYPASAFVGVFFSTAIASAVILWFPWILSGLIYLMYFA